MKWGPTKRKQLVELDEVTQRHVKHPEKALERCVVRHELDTNPTETWIGLALLVVVGLEDDVVGLGEAHDEDEVDDKESEKVLGNHPVDHDHKGADNLNSPAKEE